ncbi:MAG: pentapeptide repeat-containing protein [Bryobacterales bacterium]|nr:pentapeptide repeat-containing protein [Bryobacterales bacterium]MDE0625877.1 pentapeptide repeat-containing protein [Bryobacterales bacterium]
MKLPNFLRSFWNVISVTLIVVPIVVILIFWDWLAFEPFGMESRSATLRNIVLAIAGPIAIVIATWRNVISNRSLLNERSQKGAEMLGSEVLSVRLGGIYALQRLARDVPEEYHVQIMRLLCAFVRYPTEVESRTSDSKDIYLGKRRCREDVQEAMRVIGGRSEANIVLEKQAGFYLNLNGADLVRADLTSLNLTGAFLLRTRLRFASLVCTNLSDIHLGGMSNVVGLTQVQLDQALANSPPDLGDICDIETEEPLEWRGRNPLRKF